LNEIALFNDIIGFCETFFHKIFQLTLNINGYVQERKDRTENCGGGWLEYISENLEYTKANNIRWVFRLQ
jgi:hypothetical protein